MSMQYVILPIIHKDNTGQYIRQMHDKISNNNVLHYTYFVFSNIIKIWIAFFEL